MSDGKGHSHLFAGAVLFVALFLAAWLSQWSPAASAPLGPRYVNVAVFTQDELSHYNGKGGEEVSFTVQVNKSLDGPRLGMRFVDGDDSSLRIEEVYSDGLIAEWNKQNPARMVLPGDSLVSVNGESAAEKIVQECGQAKPLVLTVARKDDGSILLAVLGRVFNVTTGIEYYSPKETYRVFAGRECTYNMAVTSVKKKFIARDLDGVTDTQLEHLNETYWVTYVDQYPIVGVLQDSPFEPSDYDHFAGSWADAQKPQLEAPAPVQNATRRESRCPVRKEELLRVAKNVGNALASFIPRMLLGAPADS